MPEIADLRSKRRFRSRTADPGSCVALEKFANDPGVAFRLLNFLKDKKRPQWIGEVLAPALLECQFDFIACTNAAHLYLDFEETASVLRPGGKLFYQLPQRSQSALEAQSMDFSAIWVINDLAEEIVRSDQRYIGYQSVLDDGM